MRRKTTKNKSQTNQLRIIGGDWRGRKLNFPDAQGLRPTPDRVRETLFNWLMPIIRGARCLDLFAGSGALGLESLSRGAAELMLVDNQAEVITALEKNCELLQVRDRVQLQQGNALQYLQRLPVDSHFDIIFLDPPYHQGLVQPCIDKLYAQKRLRPSGYLYFEISRDEALPELPARWEIHRQKMTGQVGYYLVRHADQG